MKKQTEDKKPVKPKPVPVKKVKAVADSLKKTGKPADMKRSKELQKNVSTAVSKANANKPTKDSTAYFKNEGDRASKAAAMTHDSMLAKNPNAFKKQDWKTVEPIRQMKQDQNQAALDAKRQANKGKKGYDKNGYPKK